MAPSKSASAGDKEVVALIKKGVSIPKAAEQLKVTSSLMAKMYYRLEPVADPSLQITGTPKGVSKAIVDGRNGGLRWERLAARSGKSVSEVKAIFEETTGTKAIESYSGRGRHFGNGAAPAKKTAEKATTAKKAPVSRKPVAKTTPKARTRAERAQKTGNPS